MAIFIAVIALSTLLTFMTSRSDKYDKVPAECAAAMDSHKERLTALPVEVAAAYANEIKSLREELKGLVQGMTEQDKASMPAAFQGKFDSIEPLEGAAFPWVVCKDYSQGDASKDYSSVLLCVSTDEAESVSAVRAVSLEKGEATYQGGRITEDTLELLLKRECKEIVQENLGTKDQTTVESKDLTTPAERTRNE